MNFGTLNCCLAMFAEDVERILNGGQSADTGAFEGINQSITNIGHGVNGIITTVAVVLFMAVGGWTFVKGFLMGSPQDRSEFKAGIAFKAAMIVLFFALTLIIGLLAKLGKNLF